MTASINPDHRRKLRSSALDDRHIDTLAAAGVASTTDGRLLIPYRNPDGSTLLDDDGKPWQRWRLPQAEIYRNPEGGKYRSRKGSGCRPYHPALSPDHEARIANPKVPLRITEGEFKAESCAVHDPDRVTVALGGVWGWVDHRSGSSAPLPELLAVPLEGREVRLCFDSDFRKPQVRGALRDLALWLDDQGAKVLIEMLPNAPRPGRDGKVIRLGADDLIYGYGVEGFRRIAQIAKPCVKREEGPDGGIRRRFLPPGEPSGPEAAHDLAVYAFALLQPRWRMDPEASRSWWMWTGTHWGSIEGNDLLLAEVDLFLRMQDWRRAAAPGTVAGIVACLRRQVGELQPLQGVEFVPCRNGLLHVPSRDLRPHHPANGNTWALRFDWDPKADHTPIERFLLEALGDPVSVAIFRGGARRMICGPRFKGFLEIPGPPDSGKSIIANLLAALVGPDACAAIELASLEDRSQRFETYRLRGRRLVIASESQDYHGPLERLKALTGGDPIRAERKGSSADVSFYFHGLVVVVGNAPIRSTDASAAVLNRRRLLPTPRAVPPEKQRPMLDRAPDGGWTGELAPFLPGLLRWVLEMDPQRATVALSREHSSPSRVEAELAALIGGDSLAEWADESLVFDPEAPPARVGVAVPVGCAVPIEGGLFPHYQRSVRDGGGQPVAVRKFKERLVALLRDHLRLPLPPGPLSSGPYRARGAGSVVPFVRFRRPGEAEAPGIIRLAMQRNIAAPEASPPPPEGGGTDPSKSGTDAERMGVSQGMDGTDGTDPSTSPAYRNPPPGGGGGGPYRGNEPALSVSPVPSVPGLGSIRSASVPIRSGSVPLPPERPSAGATQTTTEAVADALAKLKLAPSAPGAEKAVLQHLGDGYGRPAVRRALDSLIAEDREAEQAALDLEAS
jgi:hypothetical protein